MTVFTLVNFGLYMFLLLRVKEITGSIITAIALGVLFNFIWASFSIPFGSLSDKIGRKKVLMAGYILFFLVTLGFVYLTDITSMILLFVLYGLVWAIINTVPKAFVSDLSGTMKGTAHGFYQFMIGIISIVGGLIAGALWDITPETMFTYMSVIALVAIVLFIFVKEK
jgi:MFS family permease